MLIIILIADTLTITKRWLAVFVELLEDSSFTKHALSSMINVVDMQFNGAQESGMV